MSDETYGGAEAPPFQGGRSEIGEHRAAGRRFSGRSMLRPYGMLIRQYVWELIAGGNENRDAGLKPGATKGEPRGLSLMASTERLGKSSAGAACCDPTEACYGNTRLS